MESSKENSAFDNQGSSGEKYDEEQSIASENEQLSAEILEQKDVINNL